MSAPRIAHLDPLGASVAPVTYENQAIINLRRLFSFFTATGCDSVVASGLRPYLSLLGRQSDCRVYSSLRASVLRYRERTRPTFERLLRLARMGRV